MHSKANCSQSSSFLFVCPQSAPLCNAKLTFTEDISGAITLEDTNFVIDSRTITFNSQLLKENREYIVNVNASNVRYSGTVTTMKFSKLDIIHPLSVVKHYIQVLMI